MADTGTRDYQSYLLRIWRTGSSSGWRATLQSTATERLHHFSTLEDLLAFLEQDDSAIRKDDADRPRQEEDAHSAS